MGGGGGSTTYEPERVGVDRRRYGQLSTTGIQTDADYKRLKDLYSSPGKTQDDFMVYDHYNDVYDFDQKAYNDYQKSTGGATYDAQWGRWKLANGVDMQAALTDWENYKGERAEIATYSAKEARNKVAPTDLSGTKGNVDYSLESKPKGPLNTEKMSKDLAITKKKVDGSKSTASTNQSLGIY